MSGATLIEVGGRVPLALALPDGSSGEFPQAEVYDPDGNNLATISLSHSGDGLYQPASAYSMPDEVYISAVYIVYTDSGHTTESSIYQRDIDVFRKIDPNDYKATGFATLNPPSQNLADYKATGFSTHSAADVWIAANRELSTPNNYKADISGLATTADMAFLKKIVKNEREVKKTGSSWYLIVYDDDGITELLNKKMLDKDGNDITDLEAKVWSKELASSV